MEKPLVPITKVPTPGRNLATIKYGLDAEIEKSLNVYGKDDQRLSKIYWPRSFRILCGTILQSLLVKREIWEELRTPNFDINPEQLQQLIDELKYPTSNRIRFKQRRWIIHLLREVSISRKKFGLGPRLLNNISDEESIDWPADLEDKDDLMTALTDMSLRDDVKRFLWNILDDVVPREKYCVMHYFGALKSVSMSLPIVVEIPEEYVETISHRFATISDQLRASGCDGLLPVDLVTVKGVPSRNAIESSEEGFYTSGSPWKEGTIGGIIKYGETFVGLTSGHVHRASTEQFDALTTSEMHRVIDPTVDVAFFFFREEDANDENLFNLLPMFYMNTENDVVLIPGEDVYKIGRSTGLTMGTLGSTKTTFRSASFVYKDHIQVIWKNDGCRFAFSRDCGSIYCVKRGPHYVPIGIHRISDIGVSYGCSIWKAMEYFPTDANDESNVLHFVEPLSLVI